MFILKNCLTIFGNGLLVQLLSRKYRSFKNREFSKKFRLTKKEAE